MMASLLKIGKICRSLRRRINKINGRHEETRTPDLYRVNSEVNNLKPFACLAFPHNTYLKTPQEQHIFGDESVTSFHRGPSAYPKRVEKFSMHLLSFNVRWKILSASSLSSYTQTLESSLTP